MTHRQTQHGVAKGELGSEIYESDRGKDPRTYLLVFPVRAGPRPCPFEGCSGQASTRKAIMVHFWHQHVRDTVLVLD